MFSSVAALQAAEDAQLGAVPVTTEEALGWARENKVALVSNEPADHQLRRINAARREYRLPLFVVKLPITRGASPKSPVRAPSSTLRPRQAPPFNTLPATSAAEPKPSSASRICASQDELLDLVTGFEGTRTGLVTPEIARWLLALNSANRPLQKAQVQRFREILARGAWLNTGEPIIVSREGVLNDGQHRLSAVAASGIPALMDVRFGIVRSAFAATGTGTRRTAGQALGITGAKNASTQAAIARLLAHYDAGQMARASQQVENGQILDIIAREPRIAEIAAMIQRHRFAPARTAPLGLILVLAARSTPMQRICAFASVVNTGRADSESDPAYQLHLRLRDAALRRERISQIDAAALAARAWNAWSEGRALHRLVLQDGDRSSEGFPRVHGSDGPSGEAR
ncbi:MAG TPA: hypothetical protein VNS22_01915 [Geminicoccus sp.]|uniref:hypothetical protein n=1 Tax=Geminicoccus sp. TaxID=2024832 RepID=UPI002C898AD5|nr:hypothetical protein [Geminicoccus sp.]HWL67119.1 hypothetical protein [Geminicoccus sp.]